MVTPLSRGIFALGLLCSAALADEVPAPKQALALEPYTARYQTTAMGIGMKLERTLAREGEVYTLSNIGEIFVAKLEEIARFTLVDGRIRGETFTYQMSGIVNRRREVQFEPESGVIRSLKKKEWTEHAWSPEVLDRLSQQEAMRLELMNRDDPTLPLDFTVVDGPRISTKRLEYVSEETLKTEVGPLATLHYRQIHDNPDKRASDIWLAKDFDYLMVRTRHVENDTTVEINLLSAEIGGRAVLPVETAGNDPLD